MPSHPLQNGPDAGQAPPGDTSPPDASAPDAALDEALAQALRAEPARVEALDLPDGRRFWLKRTERLSRRLRLQKGDPRRAFEAERAGLHALHDQGLPVPAITREGSDYLVLPDAGPTLMALAQDPATPATEVLRAFQMAGKALALLHRANLSHGRPAPRDICWDGTTARFIDLERFSPARRSAFWQALDVVIFTQSCFSRWPEDQRWLDAALAAYAGDAPEGAMARVAKLARRLRPLLALASMARWLKPRSREIAAISLTLRRLQR